MSESLKKTLPPLISLCVFLVSLELLSSGKVVSPQLLPPPSLLYETFISLFQDFKQAFVQTAGCVLMGLAGSSFLGVLIAILCSLSVSLRRAILPFAIFFQTVPIIAVAPLLVIYFGFGPPTVVASSLIVAIFPVIANTLIGLESISQGKLDLFRIYRAHRWQVLWKLRWPSAYPSIYTGIKVACGLAVIGAIAGEFVAGGGLGAMIDSARTQQRIDIVFVCLFLLSGLGLLLVGLLQLLNYLVKTFFHYGLTLKD